jgi:hypothetical protein
MEFGQHQADEEWIEIVDESPQLITEIPEPISSVLPLYTEENPIAAQWRWVLKWWVALVSILTLHVPVFVFLVGTGILNLPSSMFIAYVSAATGGNTLLALAGTFLLRPFAGLR